MLEYIEELFKSEELIKNKNLIHALLYHADIYRNPKSNAAAKAKAKEAIKLIGSGKMPKEEVVSTKVKTRKEAGPRVIKDPPAGEVKGVGIEPSAPKHQYNPAFKHYNISKEHWNSNPSLHQNTIDFHNEVLAGKHPDFEHVRAAAGQKMKKSLENVLESIRKINANLTRPE